MMVDYVCRKQLFAWYDCVVYIFFVLVGDIVSIGY